MQISSQFIGQNTSEDQCLDKFLWNVVKDFDKFGQFKFTCSLLVDDIEFKIVDARSQEVIKECFRNSFDLQTLPEMNVGPVYNIEIRECKIPYSLPLLSMFNILGITSTKSLSLTYNNQNLDFPYQTEHFRGLKEDGLLP